MDECGGPSLAAKVNKIITPEQKKLDSPKLVLSFFYWFLTFCINFK